MYDYTIMGNSAKTKQEASGQDAGIPQTAADELTRQRQRGRWLSIRSLPGKMSCRDLVNR